MLDARGGRVYTENDAHCDRRSRPHRRHCRPLVVAGRPRRADQLLPASRPTGRPRRRARRPRHRGRPGPCRGRSRRRDARRPVGRHRPSARGGGTAGRQGRHRHHEPGRRGPRAARRPDGDPIQLGAHAGRPLRPGVQHPDLRLPGGRRQPARRRACGPVPVRRLPRGQAHRLHADRGHRVRRRRPGLERGRRGHGAPRRPGSVYGEEYRLPDALTVVETVRRGQEIPPTPRY